MYHTITPLIIEQAKTAILRAPAPLPHPDSDTRGFWRKKHDFVTEHDGKKSTLLPSECYFLTKNKWTIFEDDGITPRKDNSLLQESLKQGEFDNYIVRNQRGEIVATTDDFGYFMTINLDQPNQTVRIDNKGVFLGNNLTVENLRTGVIRKDGILPIPAKKSEYELIFNTHSMGCVMELNHENPLQKLTISQHNGGAIRATFAETCEGTRVKIVNNKPARTQIHHKIQLSSQQTEDMRIEDHAIEAASHKRTLILGGAAKAAGRPNTLVIETPKSAQRAKDESDTYRFDFIVRDKVGKETTAAENCASYSFCQKPNLTPDGMDTHIKKAAAQTRKKAENLKETLGLVPLTPEPFMALPYPKIAKER